MSAPSWMIYGANGYTGRLVAEEARRRGLRPILAGRDGRALAALGSALDLETRTFPLDGDAASGLSGLSAVLHCAGPFSRTQPPMLAACLRARVHYLDITGEIAVFERVHAAKEAAASAGIVAMPGVGFDVVPSDCLAAMLKRRLPDAVSLALAFKLGGRPSRGTLRTALEGLGRPGLLRDGGRLVEERAPRLRMIRFSRRAEPAIGISWGDVSTAFISTGIPRVEVFTAASESAVRAFRVLSWARPLLASRPVQRLLRRLIDRMPAGLDEAARAEASGILWGEAVDASGDRVELRMATPDGYDLTVDAALLCLERVLSGRVAPGTWTPSAAFGPDFALELRGVRMLPAI